jgi:hypothetical protein
MCRCAVLAPFHHSIASDLSRLSIESLPFRVSTQRTGLGTASALPPLRGKGHRELRCSAPAAENIKPHCTACLTNNLVYLLEESSVICFLRLKLAEDVTQPRITAQDQF